MKEKEIEKKEIKRRIKTDRLREEGRGVSYRIDIIYIKPGVLQEYNAIICIFHENYFLLNPSSDNYIIP